VSVVYGIAGLLAGIAAGACLLFYVPPYSWIADAQLSLFHVNLVSISFFATFALTALPFVAMARALETRLAPSDGQERGWDWLDRFFDTWPGKGLLAGATICAVSLFVGYRDASRGPLVHVDLASLEAATVVSPAYAELTSRGLRGAPFRFRHNSSEDVYVPVVSGAESSKVAVFLLYRQGRALDIPLRGTLDRDDLPGEVRSAYESRGLLARTHYVLDVGADPVERAAFATKMFWAGLVVTLVALGAGFASHRGSAYR
jgi:hypothetical protein